VEPPSSDSESDSGKTTLLVLGWQALWVSTSRTSKGAKVRKLLKRDVNARVKSHPKSVLAFGQLVNDPKFVKELWEARHCKKAQHRVMKKVNPILKGRGNVGRGVKGGCSRRRSSRRSK